jgi:hypothetical protein
MCTLAIRGDIGPQELRRRARQERDGRVAARLIAIANALEGMDRASAARLAGMDRQTLRDWVHRYNVRWRIVDLCRWVEERWGVSYSETGMRRRPPLGRARPAPLPSAPPSDPRSTFGERPGATRLLSPAIPSSLRLLWSLDLSHRKTRPRHPQTDEKAQQAFKKGSSGGSAARPPAGCAMLAASRLGLSGPYARHATPASRW